MRVSAEVRPMKGAHMHSKHEPLTYRPMTYREIREYVDSTWGTDLPKGGELPDDIPWAVERWLTHEMLPTIRRTGGYRWPEYLDQLAESSAVKA